MRSSTRPVLAVLLGNRDFFPDRLVAEARTLLLTVLERAGVETVALSPEQTKLGGVETRAEAECWARMARARREEIDGVLVCLPNFGDEQGVAEALTQAGLDCPILVQACPDEPARLEPAARRDSYCGKISVCNNLVQRGVRFSLTRRHVTALDSPGFAADLAEFIAVCRVVRGLRGARLGAIGARPGAFQTVRYSEKLLQRAGITVTTVDLSEILARAAAEPDGSPDLGASREALREYLPDGGAPADRRERMARLDLAIHRWAEENGLAATAVQCWTALQHQWGCNACTTMSRLSESGRPSACEVDVTGALSMLALQLATGHPAALVDWNNNYADDPDRCVLFHCGNWPRSLLRGGRVATAPILGSILGEANTWGALEGRAPAGPVTFARITTDDGAGRLRAYTARGELTDDPLDTFGCRAVARIPRLEDLLAHVCRQGFEHHVAVAPGQADEILREAFANYLGWETHWHR